MKSVIAAAAFALAGLTFAAQPASAAGCLTGAALGAGAGHLAGHHAVLGGIAGCAIGHHHATTVAREKAQAQSGYDQQGGYNQHGGYNQAPVQSDASGPRD